MSFRQSFSRFRKKAKDKLSNIRNSTKDQGTSAGGEGLDHSNLSLQSEPAVAVGAELGEDAGTGVGNDDSLPASQLMAELECEPGGSDDYTAQQERGQEGPHLHTRERTSRGSSQERGGTGRKRAGQVDFPRSEPDTERRTPPILQDSQSESM